MTMKKPGKAHKAAKQQKAAKHRARSRRAKEMRREGRRSRQAAQRVYDAVRAGSAQLTTEVIDALKFCKHHDLAPSVVLEQLLAEALNGQWLIRTGMSAHAVTSEATRAELVRRLSVALFGPDWEERVVRGGL